MKRFPIPAELKLETYEIRKHEALFDRVELAITFMPGKDNLGAIVKSYIDAIGNHDEIVKLVEEKWLLIDGLKRDLNKKNRLFRNLDGAWTEMNRNPEDFSEYVEMLPRMRNIEDRLKKITDSKAKARAELEYQRFSSLQPICSKLHLVHIELGQAREIRDEARRNVIAAERELMALRDREKEIASCISDDHVIADERKIGMAELFLNVRSGYILSAVNGNNVENMEYGKAIEFIKRLRSPHKAEFKRYDYRFDPFNNIWRSLPKLRGLGVCVEDPMLNRAEFVSAASRGDIEAVKKSLLQGEDPNACDYTGCTALQAAAINGHLQTVKALLKAGADVNTRDKNMMTPLLCCVRTGNVEMVWQLKENGADPNASDRNLRNASFYCLLSGEDKMVRQFIKPQTVNDADAVWGFTALHIAASQGKAALAKLLLTVGSSIYRKDKKDRTPEEVAIDGGHDEVRQLLEDERLMAPAQLVYVNKNLELAVWVGDQSALHPGWCTEVGVTDVVMVSSSNTRPPQGAWLLRDPSVKHIFCVAAAEDDDSTDASWTNLSASFNKAVEFMIGVLKKGSATILVCDPTGNSTSIAILCVTFLLRFRMRSSETIDACVVARPSVRLSLSLRRGLEFFEQSYEKKRLRRLEDKLRHSIMISSTF